MERQATVKPQQKFVSTRAAVRAEYNHNGYEVWSGNRLLYAAGNHVHDSIQPALRNEDRLSLRVILKFCIKTTREMASERSAQFAGVERV